MESYWPHTILVSKILNQKEWHQYQKFVLVTKFRESSNKQWQYEQRSPNLIGVLGFLAFKIKGTETIEPRIKIRSLMYPNVGNALNFCPPLIKMRQIPDHATVKTEVPSISNLILDTMNKLAPERENSQHQKSNNWIDNGIKISKLQLNNFFQNLTGDPPLENYRRNKSMRTKRSSIFRQTK